MALLVEHAAEIEDGPRDRRDPAPSISSTT
jgi:hypothetical protein